MKLPRTTLSALLCALALSLTTRAQEPASQPAEQIRAAAEKFLSTLDEGARAKVIYDFKDDAQRRWWSNLPGRMYKRGGLRIGDLTAEQQEAVWSILRTALSPAGFEKVSRIVEAEDVLGKTSNREMFSRGEFWVSFVGSPSPTGPWMIQFGGHHLALNITLVGPHSTLAPSHTAAQPAIYELEGKTIRPLGRETDKSFALLASLNETQRKQAILGFQMRDLVLGPGRDGPMIQPEGIKGSDLTEQQREALLDLASEWTGILHEGAAKTKLDEIRRDIAETWFAWSGPTEAGAPAYFRIQGPTVFIEYAPQKLGGDPTRHIHTIYRDPTNEYGAKWWKDVP